MLVILSPHLISEEPIIGRALRPDDLFAIVPLRYPPVLSGTGGSKYGTPVGLVDPLDMFPEIYECPETSSEHSGQVRTRLHYPSSTDIIYRPTYKRQSWHA